MELFAPPKRIRRPGRRPVRDGRGVALILVLTTIAILTAIAADFVYNSRVNLELAATSRDALRARSLAMSGMNFSRLILKFQKQLDGGAGGLAGGLPDLMKMLPPGGAPQLAEMASKLGVNIPPGLLTGSPDAMSQLMGLIPGAGGAAGGGAGGAGGGPPILLAENVPISSQGLMAFVTFAVPGEDTEEARRRATDPNRPRVGEVQEDGGEVVEMAFGEFDGDFSATTKREDQKINIHRLHYALGGASLATLSQLYAMVNDPKFDFLFDEEDANRDVVRREDVLIAMKDFIDEDEQGSSLDPTNLQTPFVTGFGDENGPYSRYKRRYKAKNAKLDSIGELQMVYGISDAFMAAFGDRLTIYPDPNSKLDINTEDPLQFIINIITAADNPNDPAIRDPLRLQFIKTQMELAKSAIPGMGLQVGTYARIVESAGIRVKPTIISNSAQNVFLGDRSSTFRIVAKGTAGRVTKTLTAVVRYDDGMGQLLYWYEE